jgi:hypothetical protein
MFLVDWQPAATDDLATICLNHPDRWSDIDAAENDIDYKLRKTPFHFSEDVAEGLRRIISSPLAIYFSTTANHVNVEGVGWVD